MVKGFIVYLGIRTIIRSKKILKADLALLISVLEILIILLRNLRILTMRYSYFYLAIQLVKFMMRLNMRVVPVRTKITNTQKMNNSEMSAENIPN